ncbi:MAG: hypothetical protein JWN24_4060 [Phycisphaerales bacterium]|nr:hypothetical protein [Phycisphaerales bacterium]
MRLRARPIVKRSIRPEVSKACNHVVERLEDRRLFTVVFNTQFGAESLQGSAPFKVLNSPTFHLLLWGSSWGTGAGQFNPATAINEATAILNSTYLSGLSEYGITNTAPASIDSFVDTANPPADFNPGNLGDGHSLGEAQTEFTSMVTANNIPGPGSPSDLEHAPIYVVITDPNHSGTNGGYNTSGTVSSKGVNIFSVGTDSNFNNFGDTFSHETAERMSDVEGGGVTLKLPSVVPVAVGNGGDLVQIGDGEAEPGGQAHYTYHIGGPGSLAIVQPFYSNAFSAFIAPDGNSERFDLAPIWNLAAGNNDTFTNTYNLTINGDQLANKDDNITISRDSAGGTQVSLNGQLAWFDPGTSNFQGTVIKSITVKGLTGNDTVTLDYSSGNPIPTNGITIDGGTGNNTLVALGQANNWQITGANSGTLNSNSFSNMQNLTGGASADTFKFLAGGNVSGNINGGGGGDTLNYSSIAGPVTVNLQTNTAANIGGTFSNISSFVGSGSSADTLVGPAGTTTWSITGADSGSVGGAAYSSFENLTGGPGNDTFTFHTGGNVSGNINADGGTNTLDYSATSAPITLNLQTSSAPYVLGTVANVTNYVGSASNADTLVGPAGPNVWSITGANAGSVGPDTFSSFENLTGGPAADTFSFQAGGSVAGNIDGAGGSNTLDYSAATGPVTVNVLTSAATGIGGTFANITTFVGSASTADQFFGPAGTNTWNITAANGGSVSVYTFSSFENLTGGPGNDTFAFQPGGSVAGNVDGGGGTNTLDDSALPGPITVNLQTSTAPGIGGTFANISNFIGSASAGDTLIGPDAATNWQITAANAGSAGSDTFSSFENLTGGAGNDSFAFLPGGGVSGNIDGGGGTNTLDYSALSGPITVNLQTHAAPGIGGTFTNISNFVGSAGSDSLIGPDATTTWAITGANSGSVAGNTFSSFENLIGGSGDDTFALYDGGSLSGKVDGMGGNNTLDYSYYSLNVIVNLALNTATGYAGGAFNINGIIGGAGNNMFIGNSAPNFFTGGSGRNILIGGGGADVLKGGGGDSILIADATIYDTNMTALNAVFAEWTRTDLSFEQRVADLISPGVNRRSLNGIYTLDKKNIISDGSHDALISGTGLVWAFVTKDEDTFTGKVPMDHVTQV